MMTELRIHNFRTFRELKVEGLTRVSLLVGANNSGKSSVLDAAELLLATHPGALAPLALSALRRGEAFSITDSSGSHRAHVELSHLFHGHVLKPQTSFRLEAEADGHRFFSCKASLLDEAEAVAQEPKPLLAPVYNWLRPTPVWSRSSLALTVECDRLTFPVLYPLTDTTAPTVVFFPDGSSDSPQPSEWPVNFAGITSPTDARLLALWDQVVLTPHEVQVTEALRLIEPEIERIAALSSPSAGTEGRMFLKLKGSDQRIPLGSMGEGMKRLLVLSLNLASSWGGYLLVDEIDTGLHHSVMVKMWRLLVETAKHWDVQVLATTHSLDCVHALAELYEQYPEVRDDISLHRIERSAKSSIRHSAEELLAAARHHMEVR